jgi:2-C-methyl-D-erythritol 4-phosphate cytidylyltransferase
MNEGVALILAAAGLGHRFESETPKQFLPFRGRPLYRRALESFRGIVATAVVVVPEGWRDRVESELGAELDLDTRVVIGAGTRQESVLRGLRKLGESIRWVLVHDAARPLVSGSLVERVLEKTKRFGACIPVLPVRDTVKELGRDDCVALTLPRERLALAQTPQGFSLELLLRAFAAAERDRFLGTDESQLVERLGETVHVVEGDPANLKITRVDDLTLMASLSSTGRRPGGE